LFTSTKLSAGDAFELREMLTSYGSGDYFEADNTLLWDRQR